MVVTTLVLVSRVCIPLRVFCVHRLVCILRVQLNFRSLCSSPMCPPSTRMTEWQRYTLARAQDVAPGNPANGSPQESVLVSGTSPLLCS